MVRRFPNADSGRNWNALSTSYQQRLERAGVSRREYEQGVSVQSARGHANTPERPSAARPERHGEYLERQAYRERLIDRIQAGKREYFAGKDNFNDKNSRKAIDRNTETGRKRSVKELERAERKLNAMLDGSYDEEDYLDEGDDYDDDWLYYH